MGLLRLAVVGLTMYFLYVLIRFWLNQQTEETVVCPQCDGAGIWEVDDIDETCILCKGSGNLDTKDLEDY